MSLPLATLNPSLTAKNFKKFFFGAYALEGQYVKFFEILMPFFRGFTCQGRDKADVSSQFAVEKKITDDYSSKILVFYTQQLFTGRI